MSYDEVTAGTAAAMQALAAVNLKAANEEEAKEEELQLPRSGDGDGTGATSSAPPSATPVATATSEFLAGERRRWNPTLGDESVPLVGEFKYPLETPLAGSASSFLAQPLVSCLCQLQCTSVPRTRSPQPPAWPGHSFPDCVLVVYPFPLSTSLRLSPRPCATGPIVCSSRKVKTQTPGLAKQMMRDGSGRAREILFETFWDSVS